jgi:heme oxygenase
VTTATDARAVLRAATVIDHERVDRAFGRFNLTEPNGYAAFLLAQAYAFVPIEAAIDAAQPRGLLPDWESRRRADLLLTDIAALGLPDPEFAEWPSFRGPADILGAIYVLEGSRLGGSMLARSVPAGLPRNFIGATDSARWRKLIVLLDMLLATDDQQKMAIDAAHRSFALFEDGALRQGRTKAFG